MAPTSSSSSSPPKRPSTASSGRLTPTTTQRSITKNSSAAATTSHTRSRSIQSPNGTPLSARSAVRKPLAPTPLDASARAEQSQLMDDLRDQLAKAQQAEEELKRHNEALQARLDESSKEAAKQEEKMHEDEERIEELENGKREALKQKRELETIFEAERAAVMKDKEATSAREEELQNIVQRLKESLSHRDSLKPGGSTDDLPISRNRSSSPTLDSGHFAPSSIQRSNSTRNNSKLLLQKDKLIEELRLELAELQIKLMELENKGGGRVQDLEKSLIDARVTNARLMEENESFQSLLMEKTLNGDFTQKNLHIMNSNSDSDRPSTSGTGLGASLADELSAVSEGDEDATPDSDRIRRLEIELNRQQAENKALTLYINRIIERILKHRGGFEAILSNNDDEVASATASAPAPSPPPVPDKDKELPPPPPLKDDEDGQEPQGFLQRAKSIAYGRTRPRPNTYIEPSHTPGLTESISTAPSIPLSRTQSKRQSLALPRRANTTTDFNAGAAAVVGNMFRPHDDGGVGSPGINSPRTSSYFGLMNRVPSGKIARLASQSEEDGRRPASADSLSEEVDDGGARKEALDALTGGGDDKASLAPSDAPSPPRSIGSKDDRQVLSGNKIRPLRLVTEEQKKAGNRQSWIPNITNMPNVGSWFNSTAGAQQQQQGQPPTSNPNAGTT